MNQDRLFRDFPISVRCETSNTIAFVACPVEGKYGDVRKTLAGLLQVDFSTLGIGPVKSFNGEEVQLFNDDEIVRDDNEYVTGAMTNASADPNSQYYVPELNQDDVPGGACCVDETTFATLFPSYLESYIKEVWPAAEEVLSKHNLAGKLDLLEGSMTVATTRRTWDPYVIVKARDFIKLLARNVPIAQAQKIFQTEITCDLIDISMKGSSTRRFVKRRDRLIGPNGQTLKALEILSGCYVLVQGKTVAVMGPVKGTQAVRKIVEDCMNNIHPIYGLKQLLIKRELMKREDMKHEDWSRFIPTYKKTLPNKEKRKAIRKKQKERAKEIEAKKAGKEKSIFPPAPPKRLEDIAIESGQAFLGDKRKRHRDDFELGAQDAAATAKKPRADHKKSESSRNQ